MHHSHLKAECYNKARDSFQRRQSAVAYYYMNIAQLHNSKIDRYNNLAANAIVEVHSYTQQNPDMLDLHYLHAGLLPIDFPFLQSDIDGRFFLLHVFIYFLVF